MYGNLKKTITINNLLQQSACDLQTIVANNPRKETEIILSFVLKVERSYLCANYNLPLTSKDVVAFTTLLKRRLVGEPLAYILGEWEFWSLKLLVDKRVLIPRSETELLVEVALKLLDANKKCRVADLGTGCGAIALALASERPNWSIFATDKSQDALQVAQINIQQLGIKNIELCEGNWCKALPPNLLFDAIISNPPYVEIDDQKLDKEVRLHEPESALFAGDDGLDALRVIVTESFPKLVNGGWLVLEHGCTQGDAMQLLMRVGGFQDVTCHKDLSGHDRVTIGIKAQYCARSL